MIIRDLPSYTIYNLAIYYFYTLYICIPNTNIYKPKVVELLKFKKWHFVWCTGVSDSTGCPTRLGITLVFTYNKVLVSNKILSYKKYIKKKEETIY
jgi:hypothetical protein